MRNGLVAVFLGLAVLMAPAIGEAQVADTVYVQAADTVYVVESRSAFLSGVLEYVVPTLGFAYAGDWKRGLLPNAVRVGGVIVAWDYLSDEVDECETVCGIGVLAALGGTVWAVVDAARTAKQRRPFPQPKGSGFTFSPTPWGGVAAGFRWVR